MATSKEDLKRHINEMIEMKKYLETKNDENQNLIKSTKLKLADNQAKLLRSQKNHQRMRDLLHNAQLMEMRYEQEENEQYEKNVILQKQFASLEKESFAIVEQKNAALNQFAKTAESTARLMLDMEAIFADKDKCIERSVALNRENENFQRETEHLRCQISELTRQYQLMKSTLDRERAKARSVPPVAVRKFLLKEMRAERRDLAFKLMQSKAEAKRVVDVESCLNESIMSLDDV